MDMVAHDAEGIELEGELFLGAAEGIEQHFAAWGTGEAKLTVVAAQGDVVAGVGGKSAFGSGHMAFAYGQVLASRLQRFSLSPRERDLEDGS
jgi:gamma-glutamyltranspeptidase